MRKTLVNCRLKLSLLAASVSALSMGADAAGLGRITVLSGLGQPLRAEVEIAAGSDEIQSLTARLASPDAFRQAGIDYSPSVTGLRMTVERRGNGAVVKLSSDKPINEPFVDMLVELNWSSGRLIREYTFLLDPPDASAPRSIPAPIVAPPDAQINAAARRGEAALRRAEARESRTQAVAAAPAAGDKTYTVQQGDTLHRIATANRPEGVSVEQMLQALYHGNRSAFEGGDINRLKTGKILQIPDADAFGKSAGARPQVAAQSSDFSRYRNKLAEQAAAAPAKESAGRQGGGGKIGAKVEDRAPAAGAGADQVKVSRSEEGQAGGSGGGKGGARVRALEEDLLARDKALKEANERLAELEKNIKDLQKLVEMKNQMLAQAGAKPGATPPPAPVPAAPAKPEPVAEKPPVAAPAAEKPAEKPADKPAEKPAEAAPAPEVKPEPKPEVKPAPAPVAKPVPQVIKPVENADEGGLDSSLLLGGGGILALLLGWGGYKVYQRRKIQGAPTTTPVMSEFGDGASSVFGSAGGQSVDTGSSSIMQTDFSQSGLSSIDTDEGVDPVAEADVYMAYGRDAQAEEILLDALKTDPNRSGVHLKLLEIYAQRGSKKQFETTATELYSLTGGNGPDWEKAAAIGRKVDPDSPLYRIPAQDSPAAPPLSTAPLSSMMPPATEPPPGNLMDPLETPSELKDTWALPGELNQFADAEDIGNAVLAGATAPVKNTPDTASLDFDLDLSSELAPAPAAPVSAAPAAEPPGAVPDLDFDFGFDLPADGGAKPAGSGLEATSTQTPHLSDNLSLPEASDLDFDLKSEFESAAPAVNPLDAALADLTKTMADPRSEPASIDLERTSFDSSLLDFDFHAGDAPGAPSSALDEINLDLGHAPAETELPDLGLDAPAAAASGGELDPELLQEIATKLELARAYEEMGDTEGARELVEEVLKEGSAAQKEEARGLLARLS